jgi:aminoglycoside phosphotransferase (APT) family kinase protein
MNASTDTPADAFTGTREVSEAHRFDEARLADWMTAHVDGFVGPIRVSQFKGGQSNPTYRIDAASGAYVLRRKPPGKLLKSAHAVDREFRVLAALHPLGFPVARPYGLCEDEGVIGTAFYVMACVDGRIFWDQTLPDLSPPERHAIFTAQCDTIAALHTLDWRAAGLEGYGREGEYMARQIHRWSEQYRQSETNPIPAMNALMDWLPAHIPAGETTTLVHGDFRLDNMIIHASASQVVAVLDWELSTLGDPLADFTYHLMNWVLPATHAANGLRDIADLEAHGIPTLEQYVAMYCARTGRAGLPELDYYFAYNGFRLAAILQGIAGRVRDGTASSQRALTMAARVEPLAMFALGYARRAGMSA